MSAPTKVLMLGGTGRTGRHVIDELTRRGAQVRAIVRSPHKLPPEIRARANLQLVEANLLDLSEAELARELSHCDAVVSCLGHDMSLRGVFGPPRDLVTRAARRIAKAARAADSSRPKRLVVMTSVSVNRPDQAEPRRGFMERGVLSLLRLLVPPARDNQTVADYLLDSVGTHDPAIEWVVVRPDSLIEGDPFGYSVHESIVDGLFKPGRTSMQSLAHFFCELLSEDAMWRDWRGGFPVVVSSREARG